jgi:NAD(P)H-nitrite reductase large subunit
LLAGGDVLLPLTDIQMSYDFCCYFKSLMYNIRMHMRDMQVIHTQEPLAQKLQSAIAYLETFLELYQRKEDPLELVQPLHTVMGMLQEIRREVLLQELTTVLNNEDLPRAERKEKVVKIFQLLA